LWRKEADFSVVKHTRASMLLLGIGFTDNKLFEAIVDGIANAVLDVVGVKKDNRCPTCGQKIS